MNRKHRREFMRMMKAAMRRRGSKSWEKSITHPEVINEMLLFLDRFHPIETPLESRLGDSTRLFIERFREAEEQLKLSVKNHWTTYHQI